VSVKSTISIEKVLLILTTQQGENSSDPNTANLRILEIFHEAISDVFGTFFDDLITFALQTVRGAPTFSSFRNHLINKICPPFTGRSSSKTPPLSPRGGHC
jgi:hypothetical protein